MPGRETRPWSDDRRDEVARQAARLLLQGRAEGIAEAIRAALRGEPGADLVPFALVRQHARALALEALGDVGYRAHVAEILRRAEELMTLLGTLPGEPRTVLVGRAARGQIDADPCCRIRVETDEPVGTIAALLVDAGYEEPAFATVETRFGRLGRVDVVDDGVPMRIVRCPPGMRIAMDADLRTAGVVPTLDLGEIQRLLLGLSGHGEAPADQR